MNFKVYKEKEEGKSTYFRLTSDAGGEINLFACEEDGSVQDKWLVLWINLNGRLCLGSRLPDDIGLDLDEDGRIKVVES